MRKIRNPNSRRQAASEAARRRARARWAGEPSPREETADDARARAYQDARGKIEREGTTYFGSGATTAWEVRRSVRGSVKQLDIIADGALLKTAGRRKVEALLRKKPPPPPPGTNGN